MRQGFGVCRKQCTDVLCVLPSQCVYQCVLHNATLLQTASRPKQHRVLMSSDAHLRLGLGSAAGAAGGCGAGPSSCATVRRGPGTAGHCVIRSGTMSSGGRLGTNSAIWLQYLISPHRLTLKMTTVKKGSGAAGVSNIRSGTMSRRGRLHTTATALVCCTCP